MVNIHALGGIPGLDQEDTVDFGRPQKEEQIRLLTNHLYCRDMRFRHAKLLFDKAQLKRQKDLLA